MTLLYPNIPQNNTLSMPGRPMDTIELALIAMPAALFLILFWLIGSLLYRQGFRLSNALTEKNILIHKRKTVTNLAQNTTSSSIDEEQPYSTSRAVLLISICCLAILIISLCSYYMYWYLQTGTVPQTEIFSQLFIALGLGIIPYIINRISYNNKQQ